MKNLVRTCERSNSRTVIINPDNIMWFHGDGGYTEVYFVDGSFKELGITGEAFAELIEHSYE